MLFSFRRLMSWPSLSAYSADVSITNAGVHRSLCLRIVSSGAGVYVQTSAVCALQSVPPGARSGEGMHPRTGGLRAMLVRMQSAYSRSVGRLIDTHEFANS